jgi:hypothetical protein
MDFVTICFIEDLPQLKLQASSMNLYLKDFPVDRIIVVVNGWFNKCRNYLEEQVRPCYGRLADKVEIIPSTDLIKPMPIADGYYSQQLIKLLISNHLTAEDYCMLDAKNFLTREWKINDIYQGNKLPFRHFDLLGGWEEHCKNSFAYYGLDYKEHEWARLLTPFFAPVSVVRCIANDTNLIEFTKSGLFTEFFMMQAYIIKHHGSVEHFYHICKDDFIGGIWNMDVEHVNQNNVARKFMLEKGPDVICSGIHRKAFSHLSNTSLDTVKNVWADIGLVSLDQATNIIDEMIRLNPGRRSLHLAQI